MFCRIPITAVKICVSLLVLLSASTAVASGVRAIPVAVGSWWGYLLPGVLVVALSSLLYHMRLRRVKKHNDELKQLRSYLSNILDSMPSLLIGVDVKGRITQWNRKAVEQTGIWPKDAIGRNYTDVLPQLEGSEDRIREAVASDTVVYNPRQPRETSGSKIFEDITVYPLSGTWVDGAVIRVDDVTRMVRLQEQFRQSQKMEAVGQLAGGIAHDFNNLLQGIQGFSELAMMEAEGEHVLGYLAEIKSSSERASELTRQLLAFSRQQVLEVRDVDLNGIVRDMIKMLKRLIGEHVELNVECPNDEYVVRADTGQVGQILTNLCVNARDAMPEGGTITIRTQEVYYDADFCRQHSWAREGRFVMLSVKDTGKGIPEKILGRIFDPFFTTKELGKGTGLGLATVYGLMEQHGGFLRVESAVGEGAEFLIYLPSSDCPVEEKRTGQQTVIPEEKGSETILLAEDDETVRTMAEMALKKSGYTVLTATDGHAALRIVEQFYGEIDMAVLDVVMPRVSGRLVYDRIQELSPDVKVLFTSGYSIDAIHTNFILEEGLELIQKPWSIKEFNKRVRSVLQADKA